MKENYTYAAIFDYSEEGYINIEFPMFEGAYTCVEIGTNPVVAAQEVLALCLHDFESAGKKVPDEQIKPEVGDKQEVVFINVWMPYHRTQVKEVYTKKTLTIPLWLDMLAKQNNINFSGVLVKALKEELMLEQDCLK